MIGSTVNPCPSPEEQPPPNLAPNNNAGPWSREEKITIVAIITLSCVVVTFCVWGLLATEAGGRIVRGFR